MKKTKSEATAKASVPARLLEWYTDYQRDLPWRRNPTPYRVWLSEIMLQQTRVETVIPYFERFLERFPTLESLASAREEEVLALWSGLGYYRRARSLLRGAQTVVEEYGGELPSEWKDVLAIPGIGPYTAAAILSISFGKPHRVVDGNVERVVARIFRISGDVKKSATRKRFQGILEEWIPPDRPSDFNQAMMELGATVCSPTSPKCDACPVRDTCDARVEGDIDRYPVLPAKRETVGVELEAGILCRGERFLLEKATGTAFLDGLWLFPFVDRSEKSDISSTLASKLGVDIEAGGKLPSVSHSITFRRIKIEPRWLEAESVDLRGKKSFRWAKLEELGDTIPVSSLCLKIAEKIREATR